MNKWKNLFATQFLGVLNDNFLKSLICFVGVLWLEEEHRSMVVSIASGLLVLPFVMFSPLAGRLSKSKPKTTVVRIAKLAEVPIMFLAITGFWLESITVVLVALFFMGLQSALYSPSKYGLIRDVGGQKGLSYGTGTMEMLAFVAVLLGTVLAGVVSDISKFKFLIISTGLLGMAMVGWFTSRGIKAEEEKDNSEVVSINPIRFLAANYRWASKINGLNLTVLGLSAFWLVGSMLQMNLIVHCPQELGLSNTQTSIVIAFVAIGIGLGCWVAGLLSGKKVELGLVPIGGVGLSASMTVLATTHLSTPLFITFLMTGSFFSGFFKVPLNAWIQQRVPGRKVGDILAYNNLIVFLFILVSALLFGSLEPKIGSFHVFSIIAGSAWIMTLVTLVRLPARFVRLIFHLMAHALFKIRVNGLKNIPPKTGGLLVVNHLSLLDSFLIVAAAPRMIRFVMHQRVYEHKLMKWFFKTMNMIPILPNGGPTALIEFNERCQKEINKGHLVCVFPEGQISRNGNLNEFKKGIEYIARGISAPIIPMNIDNVIGSPLSYKAGNSRPEKFRITKLRRSVTIEIGEPMDTSVSAFKVRQKMLELGSKSFAQRFDQQNAVQNTLAYHFVATAHRKPDALFFRGDNLNITNRQAMKDVFTIAAGLKMKTTCKTLVQINLDSLYRRIIGNIAANLVGKTVLNGTINTLEIKDITQIDDKCFEELVTTGNDSKYTRFSSKRISVRKICALFREELQANEPMALFESKGKLIALSDTNVLANILGIKQVHRFKTDEAVHPVLEFDAAMGFTTNLWLPVILGFTIRAHRVDGSTMLIGDKSSVEKIINQSEGMELSHLRHVVVGTELLSQHAVVKIKKFSNAEIRSGFGMPECAPVIAVNAPNYKVKDIAGKTVLQVGMQEQKVGKPIPGVAVKVVDPHDLALELEANEEGMLLVKGANVFSGYYGNHPGSSPVFYDNWFITNVIGSINEQGFIWISA